MGNGKTQDSCDCSTQNGTWVETLLNLQARRAVVKPPEGVKNQKKNEEKVVSDFFVVVMTSHNLCKLLNPVGQLELGEEDLGGDVGELGRKNVSNIALLNARVPTGLLFHQLKKLCRDDLFVLVLRSYQLQQFEHLKLFLSFYFKLNFF